MKLKIVVAALLVAGAWWAGRNFHGRAESAAAEPVAESHAVKVVGAGERVVNDSIKLAPGARVEVVSIHGPVEVETFEGDTAEVHVETRTGDARDLGRHKIFVEKSSDRLIVRGEGNGGGGSFWGWVTGRGSSSASHTVRLRLPRRVGLSVTNVHGGVLIGELDGTLKIAGVHGGVDAARASGWTDISGVHGRVTITLAGRGGEGARVSGVHGQVELRLAPDVNADVDVDGLHGSVNVSLPNVTVEDEGRSKFRGRVGAGGPLIRVTGVHGNVSLVNN